MRKLYQCLSIILFSTLTTSAMAAAEEEQWYEIEIMVIANQHTKALADEYWPIDPGTANTLESHVLKSADDVAATKKQLLDHTDEHLLVDTPFNTLLEEDARLELTPLDYAYTITPEWQWNFRDSDRKFQKHPDYTVILHTAWRQPITQDQTTVQLQAGQKYALTDAEQQLLSQGYAFDPKKYQVIPTDSPDTLTSLIPQQVPAKYPNFSGITNAYELEGIITLHKGRYLHSHVDLVMQLPATTNRIEQASSLDQLYPGHHTVNLISQKKWRTDAFSKLQSFRMTEQRKMRTKEFHYFDHPAFGTFLRITPIDTPDMSIIDNSQPSVS